MDHGGGCALLREHTPWWSAVGRLGFGFFLGERSGLRWRRQPPCKSPRRGAELRRSPMLRSRGTRNSRKVRGAATCPAAVLVPAAPQSSPSHPQAVASSPAKGRRAGMRLVAISAAPRLRPVRTRIQHPRQGRAWRHLGIGVDVSMSCVRHATPRRAVWRQHRERGRHHATTPPRHHATPRAAVRRPSAPAACSSLPRPPFPAPPRLSPS